MRTSSARAGLGALTSLLVPAALLMLAGAAAAEAPRYGTQWDQLDADRDGVISFAEYANNHDDRLEVMDKDGDGFLQLQEYVAYRREAEVGKDPLGDDKRARTFGLMDANKDGRLDDREISAIRRAAFSRMDSNRDGRVTREELVERYRGSS